MTPRRRTAGPLMPRAPIMLLTVLVLAAIASTATLAVPAGAAPVAGTSPTARTGSPSGAGSASGAGPPSSLSVESENPIDDQGSSYNYRSYITSITPKVPGLGVEVLEFADRLLLRNNTGKTVTIYGYSGEPYARVQPNGATELNVRAPAVYLNTNFYANVTVPASASPSDPPKWTVVDRAGQFEWHDHRIHWMSPLTPPQVKDKSRRTKIFDWRVPIAVGSQRGAIDGELYWVPESSSVPAGAIAALVAVLLAAGAFVIAVRRRRARPRSGDRPPPTQKEAW